MDESDIYSNAERSNQDRGSLRAVSQRRDEYLRATGGASVHRHHHPHHHRPAPESKLILPGLAGLFLLVSGALWWLLSR